MKTKLTVIQAVFMAEKCDKLFEQAARAWVRGNDSGNDQTYKTALAKVQRLRDEAEALLAPLGIGIDYPGLYPSFKVNGFSEHTTLAAISAALEGGKS